MIVHTLDKEIHYINASQVEYAYFGHHDPKKVTIGFKNSNREKNIVFSFSSETKAQDFVRELDNINNKQ